MASQADIRNGLCIVHNKDLYTVVEFQHIKTANRRAVVRTKLKNLRTGRVLEVTFSEKDPIETARVERRPYQYSYRDPLGYVFMHSQTYEQITISENQISAPQYLKEGQEVEIVFHAETEEMLSVDLPPNVVLTVTYAEPGVRGDTATNARKSAKLETGADVMVPLFINTGDKIRVDTRTGDYLERAK